MLSGRQVRTVNLTQAPAVYCRNGRISLQDMSTEFEEAMKRAHIIDDESQLVVDPLVHRAHLGSTGLPATQKMCEPALLAGGRQGDVRAGVTGSTARKDAGGLGSHKLVLIQK